MITREEYLNALELIDNYHRQLNLLEEAKNRKKTEIKDWINSLKTPISTKLSNILLDAFRFSEGNPPFKYVEDVTKLEFMRLRQAGKESWAEFCTLREFEKTS